MPASARAATRGTPASEPETMSESAAALRVVIGGASGLIGTALVASLRDRGWRAVPLVRAATQTEPDGIPWNPDAGELDEAALTGTDAVVHLGGVNIASGRWSAKVKAAIRDSRVQSTRLLSRTLARLDQPPRTLVCASAIGYYGNRGDEILTEESPPGEGFLPELCQEWEAATESAGHAGIRVVNLRTGVVLSPRGGALARMLPAFKAGLGGALGTGRQYMSWITLEDAVRVIEFALDAERRLSGPVNVVAPHPVTNREFSRTLGRVLRRPAACPVPALAVRALFGEMGRTLLLEGQRVRPARLEQAGFSFRDIDLEAALRRELARPAEGPDA
jgi:uncharacterized protein (TIGR01777 family)